MKRWMLGFFLGVFGLSALWFVTPLLRQDLEGGEKHALRGTRTGFIRVRDTVVQVELARTPEEWIQGLAGRDTLTPDSGMLFVFPASASRVLTMRGTRMPLDIIWIGNGSVVGIEENAPPEPGIPGERLRQYVSPGPVDFVLEVAGGWARAHGVTSGDPVQRVFPVTNSPSFTKE